MTTDDGKFFISGLNFKVLTICAAQQGLSFYELAARAGLDTKFDEYNRYGLLVDGEQLSVLSNLSGVSRDSLID